MIDLIDLRFGRLIVVKIADQDMCGNYKWRCQCDCGRIVVVVGYSLRRGMTKSCGCLNIDRLTKHGHNSTTKKTTTYRSWQNMRTRCLNPNSPAYKDYGGRGITIGQRWEKFENFLEDMGEAPTGLQLDRINNNKGYYKENCRWATSKQNNRNRRSNHLITHNGQTQCLTAWAEEFNINRSTLWDRLRQGWSTEKALTIPVGKKGK